MNWQFSNNFLYTSKYDPRGIFFETISSRIVLLNELLTVKLKKSSHSNLKNCTPKGLNACLSDLNFDETIKPSTCRDEYIFFPIFEAVRCGVNISKP